MGTKYCAHPPVWRRSGHADCRCPPISKSLVATTSAGHFYVYQ
jgi:hypothetical protein